MASFLSLPPPLIANIISFTIDCTSDYAKFRLLSRDVRSNILPLIPGTVPPQRGHLIKCTSDTVAEKHAGSFVEDLVSTDFDSYEASGICAGDLFHASEECDGDEEEESGYEENLPLFEGCTIRKIFFLAPPKEESKEETSDKSKEPPAKRSKGKETELKLSPKERVQKLRQITETLVGVKNTTSLELAFNEIKNSSFMEPLPHSDEEDEKEDEEEQDEEEEEDDWIYHYPAMLTVSVPLDANCRTALPSYSSDKGLIYLRANKNTKKGDDDDILFQPRKCDLGCIFPACIVGEDIEEAQKREKKAVTVRLIMVLRGCSEDVRELLCGANIDTLLFNNVWEKHQIQPVREGVAIVDNAITSELKEDLSCNIDALITKQNNKGEDSVGGVDYHPHSKRIVRDIIHPAIYSYVKGVSELRAKVEDVEPCIFQAESEDATTMEEGGNISKKKAEDEDFWGRKYESSTYQWMPTYFDIDNEGCVTISDYVNNLVPRDSDTEPLYKSLGKLLQQALPYLESVYGYVRAIRKKMRERGAHMNYDSDSPTAPKIDFVPLRGKSLQVITKVVDYELKPGQTHKGVWHVEGMSHEEIVMTVLYVLDRDDDINGGEILFRRAFLEDEGNYIFSSVPQDRPSELEDIILTGLAPLGKVETPKGRLIVFPNSHVHKVSEMINSADKDAVGTKVSRRRIIVFFIVNPEKRIVSTREVAPQQTNAGGNMEHKEALNHRLELMKERKYTKQDWNVREIELCEH